MPAADLLSFGLLHLSPVGELLLSGAVEAERNPANHLLALHAALVVDGEDERDVRQLEKSHLEDERLFVGGVGLTSADGRLALGHLVTHGVQQGQLHVCICARSEVEWTIRGRMDGNPFIFRSFVQTPYVGPVRSLSVAHIPHKAFVVAIQSPPLM